MQADGPLQPPPEGVVAAKVEDPKRGATNIVARNAAWFVLVQVLNMPLSAALMAVMSRRLGPEQFGVMYLATTLVGLAAVVGQMGQVAALPAAVARDRLSAGKLFASSLALRTACSVGAHGLLSVAALAMGYGQLTQLALVLMSLAALLNHIGGTAIATARGFERGGLVARNTLIGQVLNAAVSIPTLLLGGDLVALLLAQLCAGGVMMILDLRLLRALEIERNLPDKATTKQLLREGSGFLVLSLVLALHPNVDAIMLSKLAPQDVIGWHAAAQRLLGFLVFPVTAVTSALYPTLCRLREEAPEDMQRAARGSLEIVAFLVAPLALGCAFYPQLGIRTLSGPAFDAANDNVRMLAPFVFFVYFSMVLGTYITALGRQRAWALVQAASVLVSAGLNPILIPHFQQTRGNGGLGVCITIVLSELLMIVVGVTLVPRGTFDRVLARSLSGTGIGAAAMAAVAWTTRGVSPWLGAPLALLAYAGALKASGVIRAEHVAFFRNILSRRRSRGPATT